jgi:hypothetical protein
LHSTAVRSAAILGLLFTLSTCAREEGPSGGEQDRIPPSVIAATPSSLAQVTDLETTIRIQFNETVSERTLVGTIDDAVLLSPLTPGMDVSHKGDALEVKVEGGLKPNRVYRVTVLPVIRDRFSNPMRSAFELVFSTGAELRESAVVGSVIDRLSGRGMGNVTVFAAPVQQAPGDTVVYATRTDSVDTGIFALRYLPPGPYTITAFQDRNRNKILDAFEARAVGSVPVAGGDTSFVNLAVMEPDTTPPMLTRGEVVEPNLIRLTFSDYLDPREPLTRVTIGLVRTDSASAAAPEVQRVQHEHALLQLRQALQVAAAAAPAGAVPAGRAASSLPLVYVGRAQQTDSATAALFGFDLPSRVAYAELADTLVLGGRYTVRLGGVTNLAGLTSTLDSVVIVRPLPGGRGGR